MRRTSDTLAAVAATPPSRQQNKSESPVLDVESGSTESDRVAWYSPDVVGSIVTYFALDFGWATEVREFGEEAVDRCPCRHW
jgi:hypothetical protein